MYVISTQSGESEWWLARLKDSGKEGYIPRNYVTECIDEK